MNEVILSNMVVISKQLRIVMAAIELEAMAPEALNFVHPVRCQMNMQRIQQALSALSIVQGEIVRGSNHE